MIDVDTSAGLVVEASAALGVVDVSEVDFTSGSGETVSVDVETVDHVVGVEE